MIYAGGSEYGRTGRLEVGLLAHAGKELAASVRAQGNSENNVRRGLGHVEGEGCSSLVRRGDVVTLPGIGPAAFVDEAHETLQVR